MGIPDIRASYNVRPVLPDPRKRCVGSRYRIERESRVRRDQQRKMPVSQQQVLPTVCKLGRFVDERVDEVMSQVHVAIAVIGVAVRGVLVGVAADADSLDDGLRSLQTMRIGVNRKQSEVVTETMLSR